MPARNVIKTYVKDSFYHIYNRGNEKRIVFKDDQDYKVFLSYLKVALKKPTDKNKLLKSFTLKGSTFKGMPRQPMNFYGKIELHAYCLMPNHFHLFIKQLDLSSLVEFMRSISTRYSMYFNKKYKRVGKLFQSIYKAVLILDDSSLLHITRYIHLNPAEHFEHLEDAYSSYADYLKLRHTNWVHPEFVLKFFEGNVLPEFKKVNSYKKFVESFKKDSSEFLGRLTLEKDSD